MTSPNAGAPATPTTLTHYSIAEVLPDGSRVFVRPVTPRDIALERQFISALSPESRRFRFLDTMTEPSESLLCRLTTIDAAREAALAATDPVTQRFVGVARFSRGENGTAEIALAVNDHWQRRGLGTLLARRLIAIAPQLGIRRLYSVDAGDNPGMRALAARLGFHHGPDPDDATQTLYTLDLMPNAPSASRM